MTQTEKLTKKSWADNMTARLQRNRAFQAIGNFFYGAEKRGFIDGMSIADVKQKVKELGLDVDQANEAQEKQFGIKHEPQIRQLSNTSLYDKGEKPSTSSTRPATPAPKESMSTTQLSATIQAQSNQIATLTAKVQELSASLPPKKERDFTKLQGCFLNAFGRDEYTRLLDRNKFESAIDLMERQIYLSGLEIDGYDFDHIEARYGQPKAIHGIRRMEASSKQEKINNYLARLK